MDARLMQALNFDLHDLHANRLGRVTPKQQIRLRRQKRTRALRLVLLAGACLALAAGLLLLHQWVAAAGALLAALLLMGLARHSHQTRLARRFQVETVVGAVELKTVRDDNNTPAYIVVVGGRRFEIDRQLYMTFTPGLYYCVYFVEGIGIISAEPD